MAVPMEWVKRRTPTQVALAVGTRELDDLPDELGPSFSRADFAHVNGVAL